MGARAASAIVWLAAAACLPAQPREATAYPVHVTLGARTLAVEYLARSIPVTGGSLFAEDYLAIEVAFFGAKNDSLVVSSAHFGLRMNGGKTPILAQAPGVVAGSLKYGQASRRRLEVGAGVGDASVTLGRPAPVERFPGDPSVRRAPMPRVPSQAPSAPGVEQQPAAPVEEMIASAALAEGERKLPVQGLLFFPYRGKPGSVKKLELEYEGPAGRATVTLLP